MSTQSDSRTSPLLHVLAACSVTALALVCAAAAVTGLPAVTALPTSYGAASPTARGLGLMAVLLLLGAGSLAVWLGPSRSAGALLVLAGLLWWAPEAVGGASGPAVTRGVGALLAPLLPAVLLFLLLGRRTRGWRLEAAGGLALLSAVHVAVHDPFADLHCWRTCEPGALVLRSEPAAAEVLSVLLTVGGALVAAFALFAAVHRSVVASPTGRRWDGARNAGVVTAAVAEVGYAIALLLRVEHPDDPLFLLGHSGRALAWSALALSQLISTGRSVARSRALAGLSRSLTAGPRPGSLTATLRALSADDQLDVLYPVGRDDRHVHADGTPACAAPTAGQVTTPLQRDDRVVAVLVHDREALPPAALEALLGPAVRLALDNERLAAERLARTADVLESRRRVVVTGDAARRQLERDLHDGAQQSLLALSFALRLAASVTRRTGDAAATQELERGVLLAAAALEDLRELAHGIHPAVLSEAGLAVALRSLAERCRVPLELGALTTLRFAPSVELAAYAVVRSAAEQTTSAALSVSAVVQSEELHLAVGGHDGRLPTDVGDRVAAVGGRASITSAGLEVVLPCAW